jgi:RNA polymerase sigma factor, sigma-70 family
MPACELLPDDELLKLLRQDHAPAFHELYQRYWDKLFYLAHKRLKSVTASEEIVQDVFLALWEKRHQLTIESLSAYLAAMTRYAVYRYLLKEKRLSEHQQALVQQAGTSLAEMPAMENRLLLDMIKRLSCKLPVKCRLVFIYNKIDDQSLPEVAKKLQISVKTAESHLTKALRVIRTHISNLFFSFFF